LSGDQGMMIAKRSVSLSKAYPIMGVFLALLGLLISSVSGILRGLPTSGIPASSAGGLDITTALPLVSVALQAFAGIVFSTPVLLLFVYDKNNGVLEYFLSLGMTQRDVYRQYLKAALMLSAGLVAFAVVIDIAAGLLDGMNGLLLLEVCGLVVAMTLPAVSFGTLVMMSFSSLQKQRVGSNQPLGMAIAVFIVMPAYLVPFVVPPLAFEIDLVLAGLIVVFSVLMYLASSRLISREKLLP